MIRILMLIFLLFGVGSLRAQEPTPVFTFGDLFGLQFEYLFSPEVEGCTPGGTNCIKEFRGYDVKTGNLVGIVTAPEAEQLPVTLTIRVTNYQKMGLNKFVVRAFTDTDVESINSNEAPAKFKPPPATGNRVVP